MSDVDRKRFARFAVFFACAGALQFCLLNPQPEPPDKADPTSGGGGAGGSGGGADAGVGGSPIDPARDASIPPRSDAASAADVRADVGLDIDAPGEDVLSPDADEPALDADAPGDETDAPGGDTPGADVEDATGEPDGHDDAHVDQMGADSGTRDASSEPDAAAPNDVASSDGARDGASADATD